MPNRMVVDRDENGHLYYTYYSGNDEAIPNKDTAVTLQPSVCVGYSRPPYDLELVVKYNFRSLYFTILNHKVNIMVTQFHNGYYFDEVVGYKNDLFKALNVDLQQLRLTTMI